MTDYISDHLWQLAEFKLPKASLKSDAEDIQYLRGMHSFAEQIRGRDLYTFDKSALNAAADLRIDTPDRVDRLVTAVFTEPRRLFLEADVGERDAAMISLRGFFGHLQGGRRPARRAGVFVDVLGEGKARIQPVWLHDRDAMKDSMKLQARLQDVRRHPLTIRSALPDAMRLAVSPKYGIMDIRKHVGIAKTEFEAALGSFAEGYDPLLDRAKAKLSGAGGVREKGRVIDDFWRMMRFRDILKSYADSDNELGALGQDIRAIYPDAMLDPLKEGLHVVAMMAVLQADTGDIRSEPRRRGRSSKEASGKPKEAPAGPKTIAPGLSVVNLRLGDSELQRMYDQGEYSGETGGATGPDRTGRARHPVRGHLFLARNGKLVWRKPHWRGSLEKSSIHRVTAPAYRE